MSDQIKIDVRSRLWDKPNWQDGVGAAFILSTFAFALILEGARQHDFSAGTFEWWGALTLFGGAYLSFCFARAAKLWGNFCSSEQAAGRGRLNRDSGNPFSELFLYLILGLFALSVVALAFSNQAVGAYKIADLENPTHLAAFFALLASAFLPLLVSFRWRKEAIQENVNRAANHRDEHISNESIAVGAVVALAIGLLAWLAGEGAIPRHSGFGAAILLVVLCIFLAFISAPHLHAYLTRKPVNIDAHAAGFIAPSPSGLFSRADNFLVRSLAPLTGALQSSSFQMWPHVLLVSIFVPLTILGYALPAPYGLVPIFFALVLAVSLGRRWAWVEDDRETAMRIHSLNDNQNIRIGFGNDLRDEALLGYVFLFVLIPLALRQIQLWIAPFAPVEGLAGGQGSLIAWAQFFGIELAKGVPIVDWADIYGIQPDVPFVAENAMSKHLVFIARLMVDLVIIAALLQAWGITQRNRAQFRLFKSGQLDMLDPFTERRLFDQGLSRDQNGDILISDDLRALFSEHANGSDRIGRGRVPYNLKRLSELRAHENENLREMVDYLAASYRVLVGPIVTQIATFTDRFVGVNICREPSTDFVLLGDEDLRAERIELERLLNDALEQNVRLSYNDSQNLRSIISHVSDFPEFFNAKLEIFELLSRQKPTHAVKALIGGLIDSADDRYQIFSSDFPVDEGWALEQEPLQETREKIIWAIAKIRLDEVGHGRLSNRARDLSEKALKWAAQNESSKPREAAKEALRRIKLLPD